MAESIERVEIDNIKHVCETCRAERREVEGDLWDALNTLRDRLDRLPVWATMVIAFLTGLVGWLLAKVI